MPFFTFNLRFLGAVILSGAIFSFGFIFNCLVFFLGAVIFLKCHLFPSTIWYDFLGYSHFSQVPFFTFNCLVHFLGHGHFSQMPLFLLVYLQLFGSGFLCAVFLVRCHFLFSIVSLGFFWRQSFLQGAILYFPLFGSIFFGRNFFGKAHFSFSPVWCRFVGTVTVLCVRSNFSPLTVWYGSFVRSPFCRVPFFIFNCFARIFLTTLIFCKVPFFIFHCLTWKM